MRFPLLLYRSAKQSIRNRHLVRLAAEEYQAPKPPRFAAHQIPLDPRESRDLLARILNENIVDFWYPAAIDRKSGGFLLNRNNQNEPDLRTTKHIVMQSRMTWYFARLARAGYAPEQHLQAARHGFTFIQKHMWDEKHGGVYWEVDRYGHVATTSRAIRIQKTEYYKDLIGQSFALYAMSEFALASGDVAARELARELFNLLETYAHDGQHGGYCEFFTRDWRPPPGSKLAHYGPARSSQKTLNTHLHLLEAVTSYHRATRDPVALLRLQELIQIQVERVVDKKLGVCVDLFERDWRCASRGRQQAVSFGHNLENIHLVLDACVEAQLGQNAHLSYCKHLFDYASSHGWDDANGGFYFAGKPGKKAHRREKVWWVQAEALLAALKLYCLTEDEHYAYHSARLLEWIVRHQIDWKQGEWHSVILENGRPFGAKVDPRHKGAYHTGRAMIECLELTSSPN